MRIRPFMREDYPAIVEVHKSLHIVWPEYPPSAQAWAEADRNRNPKCRHQRWVAVDDGAEGSVVGFSSYNQHVDDYHPQRFYINVEVRPEYQRKGIGSALYDEVIHGLQEFGPRVLRANAFTNLPQGWLFLQKRGFYEAFRETPVHLDVASFDPGPYAQLESRLNAQGIVIKSLRELESDPCRNRKLYDLYYETAADVPHEAAEVEKPGFEEWLAAGLNDPAVLPEAYFIALVANRYVGLRELARYPDGNALLGGLLGVLRDYRCHGIALAMHLRGIAYAREHGYPVIKDCTAVQNSPMQALFSKLGYIHDPEWLQCQKDIK